MTNKEKAQIIGEVVLEIKDVEQELACNKAKTAKMVEKLESILPRLKGLSEHSIYPGLRDVDFSLEGMEDPKQIVGRIIALQEKLESLRGRYKELVG